MLGNLEWITPQGNLGTIPESVSYRISLNANHPTEPVYYDLLCGSLPAGLSLNDGGLISGIPAAVSESTTGRFAVRAYTLVDNADSSAGIDQIADRTFEITVQGEDAPTLTTPEGNIGTFYESSEVNIALSFSNPDPAQIVNFTVIEGSLPPGLELNRATGQISGFIDNLPALSGADGYDLTAYDQFDFDFSADNLSKNYEFTVRLSDGVRTDIATYEIFVYSMSAMTGTSGVTTSDTFITADVFPDAPPVLQNTVTDLGTLRADNYHVIRFIGEDFDNEKIEYILNGSVPPGLTLDPDTGFLKGYIPFQGATEQTYQFSLTLAKADSLYFELELDSDFLLDEEAYTVTQSNVEIASSNPAGIISGYPSARKIIVQNTSTVDFVEGEILEVLADDGFAVLDTFNVITVQRYFIKPQVFVDSEWVDAEPKTFNLRVIGDIDNIVSWVTDSNLGIIPVGIPSMLSIQAESSYGQQLQYRIVDGELPPGTQLLSSGEIAGIPSSASFLFATDYSFTVEVFTRDGFISTRKQFSLSVDNINTVPSQNLYVKALPPEDDRSFVSELVLNRDTINPADVYRLNDPNFGISDIVIYPHAYGLDPETLEAYVNALTKNHYRKQLVLGEIKTARALDSNGETIYEVVYSEIVDNLVNSSGESVSSPITWPRTVTLRNGETTTKLYPNSLENMRDQVISQIGTNDFRLPAWMTSEQEDGKALGFVPAWVIAYVKPGAGKKTAYRIQQALDEKLHRIDFSVDRLILDGADTVFWDPENQTWLNISSADDLPYVTDDRYDKYLLFPDQTILG